MHYVDILKLKNGHYYTGCTEDLKARLEKHKNHGVPTTSRIRPEELAFYAAFTSKEKAYAFEKYLKSSSGFAFRNKRLILSGTIFFLSSHSMKFRVSSIIGWTCAILVAAFNIFAAVMKFVPVVPGTPADEMSHMLGMSDIMVPIGVLEFIVVILFLIPRTSTVGFVLMIGYMGGALATNLTHGFSNIEALPIYISFVLLTISAYYRNPELLSRLLKHPIPSRG